jgi:sulfur dioxygenase
MHPDVSLIDLREAQERRKHGVIPGSLHVRYQDVEAGLKSDGLLQQLATAAGKRLIFYCAFDERSAMAVQAAQAADCRARATFMAASRRGNRCKGQ